MGDEKQNPDNPVSESIADGLNYAGCVFVLNQVIGVPLKDAEQYCRKRYPLGAASVPVNPPPPPPSPPTQKSVTEKIDEIIIRELEEVIRLQEQLADLLKSKGTIDKGDVDRLEREIQKEKDKIAGKKESHEAAKL
jgi:hypothetical protein